MAGFDLTTFLVKILGGAGIAGIEQSVIGKLTELTTAFPDLRDRTEALARWLGEVLAPTMDVAAMRDTLWGIASDIVHGTAGSDPKAWTGSV
jgi:hypothetical protein